MSDGADNAARFQEAFEAADPVRIEETLSTLSRDPMTIRDASLCWNIACCYWWGLGAPLDPMLAETWALRAAELGHAEASFRVACQIMHAPGVKDTKRARLLFDLAADHGHPEARRWARSARFENVPLFGWHAAIIKTFGFAVLGYVLWTQPFTLNWIAIAAYIAALFVAGALLALVYREPDAEVLAGANDISSVKRRPWVLLTTPGEDGFALAPAIFFGPHLGWIALGSTLFGLLHYPQSSLASALLKGLIYGGVVYFVLPYGIWNVVAGHFLTDLFVFTSIAVAYRPQNA